MARKGNFARRKRIAIYTIKKYGNSANLKLKTMIDTNSITASNANDMRLYKARLNKTYGNYHEDWYDFSDETLSHFSVTQLEAVANAFQNIAAANTDIFEEQLKEDIINARAIGVDWEGSFDELSFLGTEFMDIYTVLSYETDASLMYSDKSVDLKRILNMYYQKYQELTNIGELTESQRRARERIDEKISEYFNGYDSDYIRNNMR